MIFVIIIINNNKIIYLVNMCLNPSSSLSSQGQVDRQPRSLAYPSQDQYVNEQSPSSSMQQTFNDVFSASHSMLNVWRSEIPLVDVRAHFQDLIASKFQTQITSLGQILHTHCQKFKDFTSWYEGFETRKSFDDLPEHFEGQLYHWVWLKEGALPIWDHGREVAHSHPESLLSDSSSILPFEGRNFLDQFYQMQFRQHEIFTKNLHVLLMEAWVDLLSCQEIPLQTKTDLIDQLFQIAKPCFEEALSSAMKKIYIPLQERLLWGQFEFGQEKLRADFSVLQTLLTNEVIVASYFPGKGLHQITSTDDTKRRDYFSWLECVKVSVAVDDIRASFDLLDPDIQNQIYELVYLDHIVSKAAIEMENHKNTSCQIFLDAVDNQKQSQVREHQESLAHFNMTLERFTQEVIDPSSFSFHIKRALSEKMACDIKAASCQLCKMSDHTSHQMQQFLSEWFKAFPFAEKMISQSPIALQLIEMQQTKDVSLDLLFSELWLRVKMMDEVFQLLKNLTAKYPHLDERVFDLNHPVHTYLNQFFMKVMHVPTLDLHQEKSVLSGDFFKIHAVFQELLSGVYDLEVVVFYLSKALEHAIDKPSDEMIASMHKLLSVHQQVIVEMSSEKMRASDASLFKTIFEVHSPVARGKFKPLDAAGKCCESSSYVYDKIAKLGFTQPTQSFEMRALKNWHEALSNGSCDSDCETFYRLIPRCTQEMMVRLACELFSVKDLSCDSFRLFLTLIEQKQLADVALRRIQDGSIQLWIEGRVIRAYDLLTEKEFGGKVLSAIPHNWIHLHVLSSLIKGSEDNSSGNTIFVLSDDERQVLAIKEFDDERSMPVQSTFKELRLWQLGMPQSNIPFDRAFMMLFADDMWIKKIERHNQLYRVPKDRADEQIKRITFIKNLFKEALQNKETRLTPRDLFFKIAGGKEEYEVLLTSNKTPWEIFERDLKGCGLELPFYGECHRAIVEHNLRVLYHPQAFECKTL
jgi:hypothetical protein